MTTNDEKILKAQIELYKGIKIDNDMIISLVRSAAANLYSEVIRPKLNIREGQISVGLTIEEFDRICIVLLQLSSEEGNCEINSWVKGKYIQPKKEKEKILSMLL